MTATLPAQQTVDWPGEPPPAGLGLTHEDRSLRVTWRGRELMRYVYRPWDPQLESPRPYLHPVRTLGGDLVTMYRPHDHVWHKGVAWSLSNVGSENFWGGPTYTRGHGYQQLSNDGAMCHDRFLRVELHNGGVYVDEQLTWRTEQGRDLIAERRRFAIAVMPDAGAWQFAFQTTMSNIGGHPIPIGSPTTEGRDNAGYSGLFWRGPRSFTGGHVVMADGEGGDEMMGRRGPWLAFVGRHDEHGRASSLLFRDDPGNVGHPTQWFVRAGVYACVSPAPFFSQEHDLADGADLTLRYDVVIVDGEVGADACASLAARAAAFEVEPQR